LEYTALYRKFRPLTFEEMVGQEHITKTLKNQIISNRIGHAYLFNGGRGTGKTSAAKVFARAINCLKPKNGEPCNQCENCKSIINGSLTDVVEMDAASNNSVEDIRSIKEEVNFLPTQAKYRVYIIDEVHMLSTGAFNALLKTLEEPPSHVKFILATTEPQKLPTTILSRCQRFEFKKISEDNIVKRLEIVCKDSNIEITKQALKIIAILSEGAMRDALSILERCIQDGLDKIDEDKVKELVGIPKLIYINKLVKNLIEEEIEGVLQILEEIINDGKDINNLIWEIIKYIKDILLYKAGKKLEIYNEEELIQIKELSEQISKEKLMKFIYELSEIENTIKWSTQKNIILQTGLIKLCTQIKTTEIEELKNRIDELETRINNGNIKINIKKSDGETEKINTDKNNNNQVQKIKKQVNLKTEEYWKEVLNYLKTNGKMVLYSNLINTKAVELDDLTLQIIFPNGLTTFGKSMLERSENINEIKKIISIITGKQMQIKYIDEKVCNELQKDNIEEVIKTLDVPVNIIEE
jgi:DNA polymerase-3 subunit gamma/tau